jgi:pimeloyl-ACP methyl ester carboxylesterase
MRGRKLIVAGNHIVPRTRGTSDPEIREDRFMLQEHSLRSVVAGAVVLAMSAFLGSDLVIAEENQAPITLKAMGSFHVGGRLATISGQPIREVTFTPGGVPARIDPNGTYQVEQMYVQYFIPQNVSGTVPLLMWHGGGLTGVTYETTPDGREGWLNYFLRRGWSVYNSDAVERGRAGWAQYPEIFKGEPVFLTTANPFERFRIGAGESSYSDDPARRNVRPGSQFPLEGYDNFVKQLVPRWTTTDGATIAAYIAEVDRVCPCVILVHSQAGQFGFKVAQARPDKVKALIAVEAAGVGDPATAAALKDVPILMVFGDYIDQDSRWPKMKQNDLDFTDKVKAAGGSVDIIDLPKAGLHGNTHMMMMDKNNIAVADVIQTWLTQKNLTK